MITYEYPLNERVRTLLRLEDLFDKAAYFLERTDALDHHVAILTLFEVLDVTARADLKSDLLQELERQKQTLLSFRNNPEISEGALNEILAEIDHTSSTLLNLAGKIGQHLRDNEWLVSIKQRTGIPGGVCQFDLPSYHYWLNLSAEARRVDLHDWVAPLLPMRNGIRIVLRLLRESGHPSQHIAYGGGFQQILSGKTTQMVRIRLDQQRGFIPEISANKYALNVRFALFDGALRPRICEEDVPFDLTFCNL